MRLRDISFNQIRDNGFIGLCIRKDEKIISEGFIGEVLKESIPFAEEEVKEQRPFFNEWIVVLRDTPIKFGHPACYKPNEDPYPLCLGNGSLLCDDCCLYESMKNEGG